MKVTIKKLVSLFLIITVLGSAVFADEVWPEDIPRSINVFPIRQQTVLIFALIQVFILFLLIVFKVLFYILNKKDEKYKTINSILTVLVIIASIMTLLAVVLPLLYLFV